jgi:hypothetical protein
MKDTPALRDVYREGPFQATLAIVHEGPQTSVFAPCFRGWLFLQLYKIERGARASGNG